MHVAEERKLVVDDLLGMPYSNGVISEEGKHQEHLRSEPEEMHEALK